MYVKENRVWVKNSSNARYFLKNLIKKIRSKTNLHCERRQGRRFSGHAIIRKNFPIFYTVFSKKARTFDLGFPNLCVLIKSKTKGYDIKSSLAGRSYLVHTKRFKLCGSLNLLKIEACSRSSLFSQKCSIQDTRLDSKYAFEQCILSRQLHVQS